MGSGKFTVQVCRSTSSLQACVDVLPGICGVDNRAVAGQQMSDRIQSWLSRHHGADDSPESNVSVNLCDQLNE
jgi:hypothetical protein